MFQVAVVGCHSPRGAQKKIGDQTLKFSILVPRLFFSFSLVTMGPIKEPCEGPLEKASCGNGFYELHVPSDRYNEADSFRQAGKGHRRKCGIRALFSLVLVFVCLVSSSRPSVPGPGPCLPTRHSVPYTVKWCSLGAAAAPTERAMQIV